MKSLIKSLLPEDVIFLVAIVVGGASLVRIAVILSHRYPVTF